MTRPAWPYWHVDAFAERAFAGNQAAVIELDSWAPDATVWFLDPQFGAANSLLHQLGLSAQGFLTDPGQALLVLVAITLWSGSGFCVVVYLAALQDVLKKFPDSRKASDALLKTAYCQYELKANQNAR